MRRFFRFSIRDLLWLTLVVAVGLGWFVHQRHLRAESVAREQRLQGELDLLGQRVDKWRKAAGSLERAAIGFGLRVEWDFGVPGVQVIQGAEDGDILRFVHIGPFEPSIQDD